MIKRILVSLLIFIVITFIRVPSVSALGVSLSLSPATKSVAVGDTFTVDMLVDTGGQAVTGIKAVLSYDPAALQVVDSDTTQLGTQILSGAITGTPLTNSVDSVGGTITYDTGTLSTPYSSHGILATISFKTLASGISQPAYVFASSSITNSAGTNLLASGTVEGGTYTVSGTGGATPPPSPFTSASPSATLPATGATENTLLLAGLGLAFFFLSWVLRNQTL